MSDARDPDGQGGWEPTDPAWTPQDVWRLDDVALLDELVHPVRGAIMRRLRDPLTVAELAERLDVPVTRLYHHIKRLDELGLVRVDATRQVGSVVERRYRAVARSFELQPELYEQTSGAELGRAVGSLFDISKAAMQREFELGSFVGMDLDEVALQFLAELHLTPARRAELIDRLRAVIDDFTTDADRDDTAPGTTPFRLFIAAFPETR